MRGWSLRVFADHVSWQTTLTLMSCPRERRCVELTESTSLPSLATAVRYQSLECLLVSGLQLSKHVAM